MTGGGDVDYEIHGVGYAQQRRADPRFGASILEMLGEARTILNVGAGAGSYEPTDRYVLAVEPSRAMRAQRPPKAAPALAAFAEALPFDDGSFDAVMAVNTVHQWSDIAAGLRELRRVARGPVVVMGSDGPALSGWWLNDYAPEVIVAEQRRCPPVTRIAQGLGDGARIIVVPIPFDCTDGFTEAFYGRPERLLDPAVRRAQSSWRFAGAGVEERFVERLSADLDSGRWDERYGHLRAQPAFAGSLRLVVSR
jgi:SAM-dependent methyltransferase